MLDYEFETTNFASIKVIGVGGAGCNAVNNMVTSGVDFEYVSQLALANFKSLKNIIKEIGEHSVNKGFIAQYINGFLRKRYLRHQIFLSY